MSWIRRRRLAKQVDGWIRTNIGPASIILSQVCRPAITESDRPVLFLTPGKRIIKGRPFGVGFDRSHQHLQGAPS